MRRAAGIILLALGVYFLYSLIATLVVFGIGFLLAPFMPSPQGFIAAVVVLGSVALAAFYITLESSALGENTGEYAWLRPRLQFCFRVGF